MLHPPPEQDDLLLAVERLKLGLVARATGGGMDPQEFQQLRKLVLGHPDLGQRAPRFLRTCHSIDEFWAYIKEKFASYAERREFLGQQFNPLLDDLETGEAQTSATYERLEPPVGAGGFGQVVRYRHRLLGMEFAFKIFAPAFSQGGEGHLDRFFREARILFRLHHRHIVRVYDVGMMGRRPFIRMEFFSGRSLNQVLRQMGALRSDYARWLVLHAAEALRHAHEDVGVVHRDIKPSNILVADNDLRVIDFGLGVFVEQELISRITKTGEGVVGGHYTAPELVAEPRLVDVRSDIYSLGAVWFEMLAGRPPAVMGGVDALLQRGISAAEAEVVRGCLLDINHRFASMSQLLAAIQGLP